MTGSIVQISSSGAVLDIACGLVPGVGTELGFALRDNKHLWGRVCRVDGSVVAILFPAAFDEIEELLSLEQRGVEIYANRQPR